MSQIVHYINGKSLIMISKYKKEIQEKLSKIARYKGNFGLHLAMATQEYDELDFISDKEMCYLLDKYIACHDLCISSQITKEENGFIDDDESLGFFNDEQ